MFLHRLRSVFWEYVEAYQERKEKRKEKEKQEILKVARNIAVEKIREDPLTLRLNYECVEDALLGNGKIVPVFGRSSRIKKGYDIVRSEMRNKYPDKEFAYEVIKEQAGIPITEKAVEMEKGILDCVTLKVAFGTLGLLLLLELIWPDWLE